jgi:hypothetical protein
MELRPSLEANSCSATEEIPSIVRNPKINYRVHKSPPLVHILRQMNPVHTSQSYFSKIHLGLPGGIVT